MVDANKKQCILLGGPLTHLNVSDVELFNVVWHQMQQACLEMNTDYFVILHVFVKLTT